MNGRNTLRLLVLSSDTDGATPMADGGPGTDSAAPHPALQMQLPNRDQYSTTGAPSWLVIDDNDDPYFIGQVRDPYVQRIECSR